MPSPFLCHVLSVGNMSHMTQEIKCVATEGGPSVLPVTFEAKNNRRRPGANKYRGLFVYLLKINLYHDREIHLAI
jgi:hypothetical protein